MEIKDFLTKFKNLKVDVLAERPLESFIGDATILKHAPNGYKKKRKKGKCNRLWTTMPVFWNGDVPFCCYDYDCNEKIGSVKKDSVKEVWNNKKIKLLRRIHSKSQLCKRCLEYNKDRRLMVFWPNFKYQFLVK